MIAERLADLAIRASQGDLEELVRILRAQGKEVEVNGVGEVTVRSSSGFTCGIFAGLSALDLLFPIALALLGPTWPFVMGDDFDVAVEIVGEWMNERRQWQKPATRS
jgi:hypothetical protein